MAKKEINVNNYNDDAIQVLEGLDAVRKRPGMYIGSTDGTGLHHLVWEIVDNAVDEALSGFGDVIAVTLNKDGSVSVSDSGRGMPTGMHAMGKPTVEVIFTVLHAGGKFGQGGYKTSGGLHGVGSSVVNALSSWLEVEITRDGSVYRQRFENGGHPVTGLEKIGKAPKSKTGTKVTFMPDASIFSTTDFKFNTISERLKESAFLLKNVTMTLTDLRGEEAFSPRDGETFGSAAVSGDSDSSNARKASSKVFVPVRARISAGEASAISRPSRIMAMRAQRSASSMT